MLLHLDYHWRRFRSRYHRARLALHARGWRGVLDRLRAPGASGGGGDGADLATGASPPAPAVRPAGGRRVLVVDATTPRADRDSGSVRALAVLRLLVEAGHRVDFLADDRADAGRHDRALAALGVHALRDAPAYPRLLADGGYDVLVACRYHLAEFLLPLLRKVSPRTRAVLDTVDLHHLREAREAELHGDRTLARLAAVTRGRELAAIRDADVAWVVSPHEAELLRQAVPRADVVVVPNIHEPVADAPGHAARDGLLFVGGGQHPPNADAVRWLLDEILPRVRRRLPDIALHLAGHGLDAIASGRADPRLHAHGHVPDLGPLLGSTRVGLAPLRFGAGVKGKVNQYMASGLAVVTTACGAEGMHLRDGREALIRDDADRFAEAVVRAHEDAALWARLSAAGRDNIARHFSDRVAAQRLALTFDRLFD